MARRPQGTSKTKTRKTGKAKQDAANADETSLLRRLMQLVDEQTPNRRRLTAVEIAGVLGSFDAPELTTDSASSDALAQAIATLPQRSREILLAILNNTPRQTIARRFGISVRAVDNELQRALEHGLRHLRQGDSE